MQTSPHNDASLVMPGDTASIVPASVARAKPCSILDSIEDLSSLLDSTEHDNGGKMVAQSKIMLDLLEQASDKTYILPCFLSIRYACIIQSKQN